ncbi:DUF3566 domain-containing protein [Corynebacterium canis]|uniref:DUF3566 domain-containing protein n=1 Tax=Corynebacterium canis TaxID=679663 RepID=A0A5C5UEP1_9CORY|nr:DUF3566 domain-containing protein [Corynebacterium canis]TWT23910.1 DUF3566 domain-containing protein [Corynebacterium canis]WJY73884.1 hypothetical protein CCANI_00050 [Corynebacterium canis]
MSSRNVTVRRVSPVSVFRTALALSLAGLVAWILCVCIVYFVLSMVGVWEQLNGAVGGVGGSEFITFPIVLSAASLFGAMGTLCISALSPLAAMMYNAFVDLFGGIVLTLQEDSE